MSDDFTVTIDDVRGAGHCVRGAKQWFERYKLDFRAFLDEGIPASKLLATGDAYGIQVVEVARRRVGDGDGR